MEGNLLQKYEEKVSEVYKVDLIQTTQNINFIQPL